MAQVLTTRRVRVTPKPGFVIKTTTTAPGFYSPSSTGTASPTLAAAVPAPSRVSVPPALKVFINIAYDGAIPAPPTASVLSPAEEDATIKRAMDGDAQSPYFVPVIVSDGRGDVDKAGKPSLVFDAIINPVLKSRITKDVDFRSFVLEIILSQVESPPHAPNAAPPRTLSLSRTLATPNIRSKGTLDAREVEVPDFGQVGPGVQAETSRAADTPSKSAAKKPLIEELPAVSEHRQPKSILKKPAETDASPAVSNNDPHVKTAADMRLETPAWRWDRDADAGQDKLVIETPKFTRPDHKSSTLSLSPDLLTLRTPAYFLQVPLDTTVDVDHARAEWRVREARVVVYIQGP